MKYIVLKALAFPSFKIGLHIRRQIDVVLWQKGKTDQRFLIVKVKSFFEENPQTLLYFTITLVAMENKALKRYLSFTVLQYFDFTIRIINIQICNWQQLRTCAC